MTQGEQGGGSDRPDDSHTLLDDLRVNLSDSVDGVRSDHAQVSHVDPLRVALLNQRHPPQALRVAGEQRRYFLRDIGQELQNMYL